MVAKTVTVGCAPGAARARELGLAALLGRPPCRRGFDRPVSPILAFRCTFGFIGVK